MTALDGAAAVVIGAGRAGCSAARLLAASGARVTVLERRAGARRDPAWPASVTFRPGEDRLADLAGVDLVVPSPGVAREHPVLRAAVARGVRVWSEIELAARFLSCPVLAVTGTNGKSTTTVLLGAILAADGRDVFVGGNLGTPLADAVGAGRPHDAAVVEVSSFQLEWAPSFRPRVAVLLNLTPDHQDRYASIEEYGEAKATLLAHQESDDVAVLNRDDPWVWEQRRRTRAAVVSFGREPVEFGTYLDGEEVVVSAHGARDRYALAESPLRGAHNRENIQAAVTAAAAAGVSGDAVRRALRETSGLPHRLEFVREHRGVRYFDDSKATNVGAVEKSIASFPGGIVLLLGGYDKGGDFGVLRRFLGAPVDDVVYFGAAGPEIARQLAPGGAGPVTASLSRAVEMAAERARPGQVVLLAPGCASFDEFSDYADRGRHFRAQVEALS
jgi:UDP-N-acetylmuramoylalanine--D-glutamate ligase